MCVDPTTTSGGIAPCPEWQRRSVTSPHIISPRGPLRTEAASGSPLGGCVGVQHPGTLHPCPNRVHPGHHGLFFHTTPTPLDAVVDSKHQSAPLRCRYLSLAHTLSLLSHSPLSPPLLGSLLFLPGSPPLASVWSRCQRSKVAWSVSLGV